MDKSSSKKKVRFATEKLCLVCEWENCNVVEADIEIFLSHVVNTHLTNLTPGDLHCHWKDCEGFTDNLSELRRHILLHAFHSKIKCYGANLQARKNIPNCLSSIQSRNIIPELPEPLICCWEECMTVYECPEHFYRHVDSHAEYDCKKYGNPVCLWQDCNRGFVDAFKVKEHLRSHTQEKLVACPTCGGMFASRTKFFDHIQRQLKHDDKDGLYICEYCPNKFNSERLLRDHTRHHVNHYKCPYCDMTCPTPSALGTHIAYRHSDEKPQACQYCDHKCKTESDLRKHLESHSMVPTYKCPVENCSYASRSQTCYRSHYRKEHEVPKKVIYKCKGFYKLFCQLSGTQSKLKISYQLKHCFKEEMGKTPLKYSCHLCEKVFSRGNYLTKHLLKKHKFRWPSGHCRFRYCLNEEGIYKLQTVRYESLELSQEMMGENSELISQEENVDDPVSNPTNNSEIQMLDSYNVDSQVSNNNISSNMNISDNSSVLNLEQENRSTIQEGLSVVCVPYVTEGKTSEEPVLIKILDVIEPSSDQSLLEPNSYYIQNSELTGVESIVKDSEGIMVFKTVDIVAQPECSSATY